VPGLGTTYGRGGATSSPKDLLNSDTILIMGSNMAENHPVGFQWVMEAKELHGAKVIHVDPRFSRTSAVANIWVPLRAGSDILFLGALINYVLENELFFREYVVHYTNAGVIIADDFKDTEDLGGIFSGWNAEKKFYDPNSWSYEGVERGKTQATAPGGSHGGHAQHGASVAPDLEGYTQDATLQHPRCVFQLLRKHFARYTPEMVERKVKGLLNKLTMERFDSISDQIIAWANKSEREKDGRTLIQVIKLVFEKATDEATFSEMYARLCRKMMEQISPKVQDDGIKNAEGKPFAGGHLFRKYLLNRCQEDFERGWVAKEATAAAAATKATEDKAVKEANEMTKGGGGEESELYSEEYYAAAKAKRRGLGLIRFIGELFKLQMLTERIMHECIKKLLGNVENPEEEEIESLCKLLTTVGSLLDTQKARAHLDVYFSRMRELTKNKNVNSRMVFMLQVSVTIPSCP